MQLIMRLDDFDFVLNFEKGPTYTVYSTQSPCIENSYIFVNQSRSLDLLSSVSRMRIL